MLSNHKLVLFDIKRVNGEELGSIGRRRFEQQSADSSWLRYQSTKRLTDENSLRLAA